ncbi:MAG: SDR family oxidoreductase [Aureispira sp.]
MNTQKVWLITGASKGLGLVLVKQLLEKKYRVAATSRTLDLLKKEVSSASTTFLPLAMDVTNDQDVKQAVEQVVAHFGQLDVVVNNAGYGQFGTLEELSDKEVRQNYEVNVFGYLNVIRHTTPFLRKQQSGHLFNISSVGGFVGNFPGWGIYCSTKFAVSGFTEALSEEMSAFGVHTTLIYPGYIRTNFLSEGSIKRPSRLIEAYGSARASEDVHFNQLDGNQVGDPTKVAQVLIDVANMPTPPLHLFLGSDAYEIAQDKILTLTEALNNQEKISHSTNF